MKPNQDIDHLRLLAIFHFVAGGILAVLSFIPLIHVTVGIAILSGAFDDMDGGSAPPAFMGWMFVIFPSMFILGGLTMSTCMALAGRRLRLQTGYMFCLVVAAIECTFMPFGTVLGVFTIIVLMRPSVRELFGVA